MAKNFRQLEAKLTPAQKAKVKQRVREEMARMPLHELRQARNLTQKQLAEALRIKQASISKIEHQTDMYISTLRNFIEALGGTLRIEAVFPEGCVAIEQFGTEEKRGADQQPHAAL